MISANRLRAVYWAIAIWLGFCCALVLGRNVESLPRVLALYSYRAGMSWTDSLAHGIRSVLDDPKNPLCDYRAEFMDTKRLSSDEYFEALKNLFRMRYSRDEFALIIACDDDAFRFLRKYRDELFGTTPVVFCGVNYFTPELLDGFTNCTGVVEAYDLRATLDFALKVHPNTKRVYVINDDTVTGVANRRRVDEIAPDYTNRVVFAHLHDTTMRELIAEVMAIPSDSLLLLMSFNRDRAGQEFRYRDAARMILSSAGVPAYGVWDFYLGSGIVGGCLTSGESQGRSAAELARRILMGESASNIPVVTESPNRYMFDYRQLVRWKIPLSALPPDSVLINQPRQQYQISRNVLWFTGLALGVLVGLVVILIIEVIERRRAQKVLAETNRRLQKEMAEREEAEKALRASEEQVRQMQKLEALGRLAGGVAHDFNNILTSVLGFSKMALEQLPANSPVRSDLEEVVNAAQRAVGVTRQLLALGRRQMLQAQPVDLNKIVTGMDRLLRHILGEDVELVTLLADNLPPVLGDTGYLEQVLLNLAVNARDAMPCGGKLYITTSQVELQPGKLGAPPDIRPGIYVQLEVRDTGQGMTPDVLRRAAEPFFTTKKPGEGSGLGLSVVYGIVRQLGGGVSIQSEPNVGTTVRVWLVAMPGAQVADTKSESQKMPRGSETILIVEDDELVRRYFTRVLEPLGYRIMQAENGHDALHQYGALVGQIDLLMTDVVMPGMSGRDLVRHLRGAKPDLKVLYVTGFSKEMAGRSGLAKSEPTLLKPVTAEKLALTVRRVLDGQMSTADS